MKISQIDRKTFALLLCLPLCAWGADTALRAGAHTGSTFTVDATTWHGDKAIRIPMVIHAAEWNNAGFAGNGKQSASSGAATENAWLYVTATAYQLQDVTGRALMGGPRADLRLDKAHCIKMRTLAVSVCGYLATGDGGYEGSVPEAHDFLREVTRDFPAAYQDVVARSTQASPVSARPGVVAAAAVAAPAKPVGPAEQVTSASQPVTLVTTAATPPVNRSIAAPQPAPQPAAIAACPAPAPPVTVAQIPVATVITVPATVAAVPVVPQPAPAEEKPFVAPAETVMASAPATPPAAVPAPQPATATAALPPAEPSVPAPDPTLALKSLVAHFQSDSLKTSARVEPVAVLRQQEQPVAAWHAPHFLIRRVAVPRVALATAAQPAPAGVATKPAQPALSTKAAPPAHAIVSGPIDSSAVVAAATPGAPKSAAPRATMARAVFSTPVKTTVATDAKSSSAQAIRGFDVVTADRSDNGAKRGMPMVSDDLTPAGAPRGVVAEAPEAPEPTVKTAAAAYSVGTARGSMATAPAAPSGTAGSLPSAGANPAERAMANARAQRRAENELARSRNLSAVQGTSEVKSVPLEKPVNGYHPRIAAKTVFTELRVPGDKQGSHAPAISAGTAVNEKFNAETPTESAAEVRTKRPLARPGSFPAMVAPGK